MTAAHTLRKSGAAILMAVTISLMPYVALAQSAPDYLDFKSMCATEYAKKRPEALTVEASRWCACMDRTLDSNAKMDYVNFFWLSTLDPSQPSSQAAAARILNISPSGIQKNSTPAAESAIRSIMERIKGAADLGNKKCLAELNYKN